MLDLARSARNFLADPDKKQRARGFATFKQQLCCVGVGHVAGDVTVLPLCCSAPILGQAGKRLFTRNSLFSRNSGTVEKWCNGFSNIFTNKYDNALHASSCTACQLSDVLALVFCTSM